MTLQLAKADWYAKLKTFVPTWVWEEEVITLAWGNAVAECCEQLQIKLAQHISDTFIMDSAAGVLDSHGAERSVSRLTNELDPVYAVRVQNLFNQSNEPALIALINKVIVAGQARIQDDFNSIPCCNRSFFCSRAAIFLSTPIVNGWSVVVDKQTHPPYSFCSRSFFCNRQNFIGTCVSLDTVFTAIKQICEDNKAMGTLYRVYELLK
jgi:hypothetical protein